MTRGCCGLGTCSDVTCYLCTVVAKHPQPAWVGRSSLRPETNPARAGTADTKRRDPIFTPRKRKALTK